MSKMKPYGRVKTVKGSSWKKDIHPPKGHKNWWEDICDPISRSIMKLNFKLEKYQSMKLSQRFGNVFDRLKNDKSKAIYTHDGSIQLFYIQGKRVDKEEWDKLHRS